jgi:hypothetical protein
VSPSSRWKTACPRTDKRYVKPLSCSPFAIAHVLLQADEAYQVGKGLTPVAAYLAQDDIIRIALEHGVDMIHPG